MNRLLLALSLLLVFATAAPANRVPREVRLLENVPAPPEAVSAGAGGPAVVLVDDLKSRVAYLIPGGACGSPRDPEPGSSGRGGGATSDADVYWLDGNRLYFAAVGAVAGVGVLAFAGLWAARRLRH